MMNTKKTMILILLLAGFKTGGLYAQSADSASRLAASYFHEAEQASADQKIWPQKLYGPMLFVDINTRTAWANMPDDDGILKADGEIYRGVLPQSIILANTAIDWGRRKWSVILWPLPSNRDDRLNLLIHESFHRIQAQLNLPAHSPTVNHLSTKDGRIYFLLELQALKAALNEPKNKRKDDLYNALLFREKRGLLFPETFKNEQILEANEGFAEYTGVIIGRSKETIITHLQEVINSAEQKESLIRSAAYLTGPVYGYLLYNADKAWTLKIDSNSNFTDLVQNYYHIKLNNGNLDATISKISDRYDGVRIIAAEKLKYEEHQKVEKKYIDMFTVKPVLVISLVDVRVGFNPNNLFDLGKYGTVYPTMDAKDKWGELEVTGTGALMKDWQIIYVPLKNNTPLTGKNVIESDEWKLTIAAGWKIIADGVNYKLIKE